MAGGNYAKSNFLLAPITGDRQMFLTRFTLSPIPRKGGQP